MSHFNLDWFLVSKFDNDLLINLMILMIGKSS